MPQGTKLYFETDDNISVIHNVEDVKEFLEERAYLAKAMGYETKIKNDMLQIFEDGILYGTYFQHKHMN